MQKFRGGAEEVQFRVSEVQVQRCTGAQVHRCTGAEVQMYMCSCRCTGDSGSVFEGGAEASHTRWCSEVVQRCRGDGVEVLVQMGAGRRVQRGAVGQVQSFRCRCRCRCSDVQRCKDVLELYRVQRCRGAEGQVQVQVQVQVQRCRGAEVQRGRGANRLHI